MNYIYLITNKINGKQYIGQTVQPIKRRWAGHVSSSYSLRDNNLFHNAIRKYGEKAFEITVLEEVEDFLLLNEKEQYYISLYNTIYPNGYNTTIGGDGVQRYNHEKIKKLWDSGYSSGEICHKEGIHPDTLNRILRGYKDYNAKNAKTRGIVYSRGYKVAQYSKDGIFIQEFPSISEAARIMGVTDMSIGRAIKRKGTSCGFIWKKLEQ